MADSVENMGYENFQLCPSLAEVQLSQNLKMLGYGAFCNSEALTYLEIPNSVTVISYGALSNLPNLETLILGTGVKEIEDGSICDLPKITNITLPQGLENVFSDSFQNIPNMYSITIPASVCAIGDESFGFVFDMVQDKYVPMPDFTIYGTKGTEAETYAKNSGIKFVDVSAPETIKLTYDLNGGTPAGTLSEEQQKQFNDTGKYTEEKEKSYFWTVSKENIETIVKAPSGKEIDAVEIGGTRYELTGASYRFDNDGEIKFLYKDKEDENKCTISFDVNGGSARTSAPESVKTQINDTGRYSREVESGASVVLSTDYLEEYVAAPEGMVLDGVDINGALVHI